MEDQRPNDLSAAALDLAARGFRIHPLHGIVKGACTCQERGSCKSAGKHPLLNDWPGRASTDAAQIREWWDRWPHSNVGIATGRGSDLVVLDVDPDTGGDDSLELLKRAIGGLPDTPEVLTGGGGRHVYFRHPETDIPNSASTLGPGLDVRGDGGCVVAPPSAHISGGSYLWEASSDITDVPVANLPDALARRLRRRESGRSRNQPGWVGMALLGVEAGRRNDMAAKLAGYFLNDGMRADQAAFLLTTSFGPKCRPPLEADEIARVVGSVARTRAQSDAQANAALDEGAAQQEATRAESSAPEAGAPEGRDAHVGVPSEPRDGRPPAEWATTDAGNADLMASLSGAHLRFDHRRRRWLVWDAHHWADDPDGEPVRAAVRAARLRYQDAQHLPDSTQRKRVAKWSITSEARSRIDGALAILRNLPPVADPGGRWDRDPWLLGCANGVVDLRDGALRDGRRDDRITMTTRIAYDPDAAAPRFFRFLHEVFDGDDEIITFVHRAFGYAITGDVSEQVIFLCYGSGANGKTTLFAAIRSALGDYAHNAPFSTFERQQRGAIPTDVADLEGRRFVTAAEVSESSRLNEARIKAMACSDRVTARHLYGHFFTFEPTAKLWLAVNHRPVVTDDSHGFWRRVRLIPFTRQFDDAEQDRSLIDALRAESAGILAWLVQGCLDWQNFGLHPPASVLAATEAYREDSDALAQFLAAMCECEPDFTGTSRDLFHAYTSFAEDERIPARERLSQNAFGRRLGERFRGEKTRDGKVYHGLRVRP